MLDTIFALATAQGRSALAVIRVSGPQTNRILITLCNDPPVPRRASLRTLSNDEGEVLDKGLVVYFPAPQSYTGEDLVEFQVHGGLAVIEAVCAALVKLGGRLAEPGEFTRRAFEAGKLDLTQAEALADLIDAETASQRRQALAQLDGQQMRLADRWRSDLIEAAAYLEAQIDFADEEIPLDVAQRP